MLHTKYQSSTPSNLREKDFLKIFANLFPFWLPWQTRLGAGIQSLEQLW